MFLRSIAEACWRGRSLRWIMWRKRWTRSFSCGETGAIAVEMESAAVLERAQAWGFRFTVFERCRILAAEGFRLDLNAARDKAGRFRVGRILAQAAQSR